MPIEVASTITPAYHASLNASNVVVENTIVVHTLQHSSSDSATQTYTLAEVHDAIGSLQRNYSSGTNLINRLNDNITSPDYTASTGVWSQVPLAIDNTGFSEGSDLTGTNKNNTLFRISFILGDTASTETTHTFYMYGSNITFTNFAGSGSITHQASFDMDNALDGHGNAYSNPFPGDYTNGVRNNNATGTQFRGIIFQDVAFATETDYEGESELRYIYPVENSNTALTPIVINCNLRINDRTRGELKFMLGTYSSTPTGRPNTRPPWLQLMGGPQGTQSVTGTNSTVPYVIPNNVATDVNIGLSRFGSLAGSVAVEYLRNPTFFSNTITPFDLKDAIRVFSGATNVAIGFAQRLYSIMGGLGGIITTPDVGCPAYKIIFNMQSGDRPARFDLDVLEDGTGQATVGIYGMRYNGARQSSFSHSSSVITLGAGTVVAPTTVSASADDMELRPYIPSTVTDPYLGTEIRVWPDSYWDIENLPATSSAATTPQNNVVRNTFYPDGNGSGSQGTGGQSFLIPNYPFNSYNSRFLGQNAPANTTNQTPAIFSNVTSPDPNLFTQVVSTVSGTTQGTHLYCTTYQPTFEDQLGTSYTGGFIARQRLSAVTIGGILALPGYFTGTNYTGSPRDWTNLEQPWYMFEWAPAESKTGYQLTWGIRYPNTSTAANARPTEALKSSGSFNVWQNVPGTNVNHSVKQPYNFSNNSLDLSRTDVIVGNRKTYWDTDRQRTYYEPFTSIINDASIPTTRNDTLSYAVSTGIITVPVNSGTTLDPDAIFEISITNSATPAVTVTMVISAYRCTVSGSGLSTVITFNVNQAFIRSGTVADLGTSGTPTFSADNYSVSDPVRIECHAVTTGLNQHLLGDRYDTTGGPSTPVQQWESADDFIGAIQFLPLRMAKTWSRRTNAQKSTEINAWCANGGYINSLAELTGSDSIGFTPIDFDTVSRTATINNRVTPGFELGTTSASNSVSGITVAEFAAGGAWSGAAGIAGEVAANDNVRLVTDFGGFILGTLDISTANRLLVGTQNDDINPIVTAIGTGGNARMLWYFDTGSNTTPTTAWAYFNIAAELQTGYYSLDIEAFSSNSDGPIDWNIREYANVAIAEHDVVRVGTAIANGAAAGTWWQWRNSTAPTGTDLPGISSDWVSVTPRVEIVSSFQIPPGLTNTSTDTPNIVSFNGSNNTGRIPYQTANIDTLTLRNGTFHLNSNRLDCGDTTHPHVNLHGTIDTPFVFSNAISPLETRPYSIRGAELNGDIIVDNESISTNTQYLVFDNCTIAEGGTLRIASTNSTKQLVVSGAPIGAQLVSADTINSDLPASRVPIRDTVITLNWTAPASGGMARISIVNPTGTFEEEYGFEVDSTTSPTRNLGNAQLAGAFLLGGGTYHAVIAGNGVEDTVVSFSADATGTVTMGNATRAVSAVGTANILTSSDGVGQASSRFSLTGSSNGPYIALPSNLSQFGFNIYSAGNSDEQGIYIIGISGAGAGVQLNATDMIAAAFNNAQSGIGEFAIDPGYNRLLSYRYIQGDRAFGFVSDVDGRHLNIDTRYVKFAPTEDATQALGYIGITGGDGTANASMTRQRGSETTLPYRCIFESELVTGITSEDLSNTINRAKNQVIANL